MNVILTIFWGIVILCIIVVVHEGGHYLAARAFKVRVSEFMIGLPGPNIGFKPKKSDTKFGLTAIPLGGYARIAGMDEWRDERNLSSAVEILYKKGELHINEVEDLSKKLGYDLDDSLDILQEWGTAKKIKLGRGEYIYAAPEFAGFSLGEPRGITDPVGFIAAERKQTYIAQPWYKRMIILFGGAGMNLIFAILVIVLLLTLVGTSQATLTISDALEGMPAYEAGLRAGDTITAVDGQKIETWSDFSSYVSKLSIGDQIEITYQRDGKSHNASLKTTENDGSVVIGVTSGVETYKYGLIEAFSYAFQYIGAVIAVIIKLCNPFTAGEVLSQSSSVIGIAVAAKEAASLGWINFIWLSAALSISIGLMNLLPLMPLDGGRMVVETIQRITRKTASLKVLNAYTTVGIMLVMVLFVCAMKQDITSLITGVWPW